MSKKISVFGSTGTIGKNTLDVIRSNRDRFQVYALAARKSIDLIEEQITEFSPKLLVMTDPNVFEEAKSRLGHRVKVLYGEEGLSEAASAREVDFVMAGMVGAAGLTPFLKAIESGKKIGLANKEVLVMAGEYLHAKYPGFLKQIIPVDSEHSAIFQCLEHKDPGCIESIIITASGGPFRNRENLDGLSIEEALAHPNWRMGAKISIDSATLMNKGLEVMEARWLFPVKLEQIKVVVHPQSIIHSMVEFCDGAILAHLGIADMRIPIQFALSYPERIMNKLPRLDFPKLKELTFEEPDFKKFPCLDLAFKALNKGGLYPAVLNAANEVSVKSFLSGKIAFKEIAVLNAHVFETIHSEGQELTIENILKADLEARGQAERWVLNRSCKS